MQVSAHRRVVMSKLVELRAANSGPQAVVPGGGGGGGFRPTMVVPVAPRAGPAAVGTSVAQRLATARNEISALRSSLTIVGR